MGNDPGTSVIDRYHRTHDVEISFFAMAAVLSVWTGNHHDYSALRFVLRHILGSHAQTIFSASANPTISREIRCDRVLQSSTNTSRRTSGLAGGDRQKGSRRA